MGVKQVKQTRMSIQVDCLFYQFNLQCNPECRFQMHTGKLKIVEELK